MEEIEKKEPETITHHCSMRYRDANPKTYSREIQGRVRLSECGHEDQVGTIPFMVPVQETTEYQVIT